MWRNGWRPFWEEKGKKNEILNVSIFPARDKLVVAPYRREQDTGLPPFALRIRENASAGKWRDGAGHYDKPQHG